MKQTNKQKTILFIIKLSKRLFYNTAVHRNHYVNLIYKRVFNTAYRPGQELLINYEGSKYFFPSDDVTIVPSLLNDNYEKYEIKLFKKILKSNMTIVDIGANVGLYSVIAAKKVGRNGHVYSFEPEPNNFKYLKRNLSLNSCTDNVTCIRKAVGDKEGEAILFKEKGSIGTHSLLKSISKDLDEIMIDTIKLDSYFDESKKIDVIKLDVEGFELSVIKGAKRILPNVDYLFFEFTKSKTSNFIKYSKYLKDFRQLYLIDEKSSKLKKIDFKDTNKLSYANLLASKVKIEESFSI